MSTGDSALVRSWNLHLRSLGRSPGTIELYDDVVRRFRAWLAAHGDTGLLDVTRDDVAAWLADMRDQGLSANTVRNRSIAIKSLYRWLADEDEIAINPVERLNLPRPETAPPKVLTADQLGALLRTCRGRSFKDRRDYALLRLMAGTGLRIAELADLDRTDIDLLNRLVLVQSGKGGKTRTVRIDVETAAALDRYDRVRARHRLANTAPYWVGHRGRFGRKGIQAIVNQRADEAGLGHVHPHQLRHSWAHLFLAGGGSEGDLQLLGGWDDPSVMRRYGSALAVDRALAAADTVNVLGGI